MRSFATVNNVLCTLRSMLLNRWSIFFEVSHLKFAVGDGLVLQKWGSVTNTYGIPYLLLESLDHYSTVSLPQTKSGFINEHDYKPFIEPMLPFLTSVMHGYFCHKSVEGEKSEDQTILCACRGLDSLNSSTQSIPTAAEGRNLSLNS